jgi:hypothetical protein
VGCFVFSLGLAVAGAGALAGADGPQRSGVSISVPDPPMPKRPIVNGHRVPPRPGDFTYPEFTLEQSQEVEDLYKQIKQMERREAQRAQRVLMGDRDLRRPQAEDTGGN